ncbi:(2,3-dihydroxybenzoyl)adenylate synthase [Undibacterium crateris]|uniref:(2,3-dihydroxybenzoyl)adenylate synthase n=1 Tax=Undibacterium crateris TaxID=2528175 RepID=UPI001389503E|nr:(2,3-dihydroxybenzoyl)adenylate synthase [Undibacterium crateris]NDI84724.1 (2,3-dihydroxybenzoyl)adenylate synthase [Undibacterium crateris]
MSAAISRKPLLPFSPWPSDLARHYRQQAYWLDLPLTDILQRQVTSQPEHIAVICGERQYSYRQLNDDAERLARVLHQRGLGPGDSALVQLPNVAEFYIVFFALLKAGIAPVNALFSHQRLELSSYASQLQPSLLIASARHQLFTDAGFSNELRTGIPALRNILVLGATDYAEDLADLISQQSDTVSVMQTTPADEVAFFQLSGGSTGTPKLIPRTHNDYYYSVRRSAEICALSPATRYLCVLPAGHNYLLSSPGSLGVFYAGGTVILALDPEPVRCFALIAQHQVNMAALVPSAVILWLQAAVGRQQQLHSLRLLQVGGASFAEALARRVPAELGCQLQQVFGMAEGLVNYTRLDDSEDKIFTSQGRPMSPDDEVLVVDQEGVPVADGETGLLLTRGPYTFRGYYQAPDHNRQVINADGFYASGDLVQKTADGYLRVVGRVKDQINRGGEKIAAEEIENLLLKHPAILQAALISIPDAALGEKSCACIVVSDSTLRAVSLRQYLREQGVADFKLPDRFQILERLPLTAVGKTDKQSLRAHLHAVIAQGKPLAAQV